MNPKTVKLTYIITPPVTRLLPSSKYLFSVPWVKDSTPLVLVLMLFKCGWLFLFLSFGVCSDVDVVFGSSWGVRFCSFFRLLAHWRQHPNLKTVDYYDFLIRLCLSFALLAFGILKWNFFMSKWNLTLEYWS